MSQTLRIGAGLALAFLVLTCSQEQVAGPQRPGALQLDLSALTGPAASGEPDIPLDSIVIIFRPAGQSAVAYDTTITPLGSQVQGDSAVLALSVPLSQSSETFDVDVQAYGADVMWYRLTTTLTIVSGPNPTPATFTARYVGTGANAGSIQVLPADTTAEGGTPFTLHSIVYDSSNTPLSGVPVGYRLSDSTLGVVSVNFLTATLMGSTNVRDSVWLIAETPTHIKDSTRVHFEPPATTLAKVSGDLQSGPVGVALPQPLSVQVRDALGAPYTKGRVVAWSVTAGAANLSAATTTSDASGNASVTVTPTASGALTVQATSTGLSGSPATFTASVTTTAPATIVKDSGDAQTGAAGLALAQQLVVRVTDASTNPVSGTQVTWSVVLGGGAPSQTTTFTDAAGRSRVTFTLGQTVGPNSITATVAGLAPVTFNATGVAGQPASVIKISGDNQSGAGGAALGQPLVVEVRDGFANPVPTATVNWTTTNGGSFAPASGPTGIDGRAQTTWTLGSSAPSQTATATVGALTPVTFSATASIGSPALSLSFAGVPGVGIGLSAKVYVDINQTAPVGGTAVTVASGNSSLFTVAPGNLTIPQGMTRDSVTITGVSSGQDFLTASAAGYTSGTLLVVVQNRNISVPQNLNVPYGQTASLPVQLPAPAPAGGVTFSVVSSAPGNVSVATPTVTILAGGQTANVTLNGVLPGPATITVSNAAYLDGVTNAATTASLNIVQASASLNASFGTQITINFESNGVPTGAPAPGISVSLTPSDLTCVTATSPVTIATGLVNTTATLTYGGSASLPCTTKVLAQATNLLADSINATVNPLPGITVNAVTVGSGLQVGASGQLGASNHGGTTVTLTSGDNNLLLSTSASVAGSSSIDVFVPNNNTVFSYTVQALEGQTGTTPVTVTATAPGFAGGNGTMSLVQGAIDLIGVPANTTTLSPTNNIYARSGIPNSQTTPAFLTQLQAVRAGAPGGLTVTFTSQTAAVGDLVKAGPVAGASQTAVIPVLGTNTPTDTTSGGVLFRPLLSGSTVISASVPGLLAVNSAAGSTVTITQPGITVNAVTVGSGLQVGASGQLGASNHGGTTVTLTSGDNNLLLSTSASVAGSSSIDVFVPNNNTVFSYTVQALEGQTGTTPVTVTATAPGFAGGNGTMSLVQGAIDLIGVPANTTTLSPTNNIYARSGIPNSQTTPAFLTQLQAVRAGAPGGLTVTFTSQTAAVGDLVKAGPVAGASQTAVIPVLGTNTPTDTTSGGVLFRPLLSGSTVISASVPGLLAVNSAAGSTVTITQPGITVNAVTVGSGLQVGASGQLGASNHGGTTVTLTSGDNNLLLSTSASVAGSSSIDVFVPNNNTVFSYTVQALEGQTGTTPVTVTATAPGFAGGNGTMSLVQGAIDLIGVPANTTTLSPTNNIYARSGIPNSQTTPAFLTQLQAVRAGAPGGLTVTFTSQTAAVGDLVKAGPVAGASQTAVIPVLGTNTPTDTTSGGVLFRPLLSGSTVISASVPGLLAVNSAAGSTVTITQPGITVNAVTVGSGLQVGASGQLGASDHGGKIVTLTSSNGALLLSPNSTTPGSSSITVSVPDNNTVFNYVVQGLEGQSDTVTATITATASGFTDGVGTGAVVPAAFDVIGLPPTPTAGGADVSFYVRVGVANSTYAFLTQLQAVRAGAPAPLTVTITSNAPAIGTLVVTAGPNATQQVQILATQTNSPTTVGAGGVAFRPVAPGAVTVTSTIPNFIGTASAVTTINVQ